MSTLRRRVIGLLHPGEMGGAVGRCLAARGHEVLWASDGRGPATAERARAAGLADAGTIAVLASRAEVLFSVCPPHAAADVAWAAHGFGGLYVDANAISPGLAREIAAMISGSGGRYVDGAIIGPPPAGAGKTRLYLSGSDAAEVRDLFPGTPLEALVIDGALTAASAVKMAYAGWTKGTTALLLAVRALARAEGVEAALLAEWARSQPQLAGQSRGSAGSAAANGWRWAAEMEEIAAAMAGAGLPDGFHLAAAEVFRLAPRDQDAAAAEQTVDRVLAALTGDGPQASSAAPDRGKASPARTDRGEGPGSTG